MDTGGATKFSGELALKTLLGVTKLDIVRANTSVAKAGAGLDCQCSKNANNEIWRHMLPSSLPMHACMV